MLLLPNKAYLWVNWGLNSPRVLRSFRVRWTRMCRKPWSRSWWCARCPAKPRTPAENRCRRPRPPVRGPKHDASRWTSSLLMKNIKVKRYFAFSRCQQERTRTWGSPVYQPNVSTCTLTLDKNNTVWFGENVRLENKNLRRICFMIRVFVRFKLKWWLSTLSSYNLNYLCPPNNARPHQPKKHVLFFVF